MKDYSLEKIWDPLTRLWHWVLALVVSAGWCLGEFMSFTTVKWHFYCGYTVLGLLVVRLVWGVIGPGPVRLRSLFHSPKTLKAYMVTLGERRPSGYKGHNPLGSLSVIVLLLLLTAQAGTGLFIESEEYFETAPLNYLVSGSTAGQLIWWHKLISKCLLAVVVLHVTAVFYYWVWKKENLVRPMLTGWKWVRNRQD